ncbi:RNA-guided endonuclease InsQ/TnpB family protein [Herbidospora daliensis]|uniref:RNA-guided endonuclease InsQ/TnpB family protein n=1 Tax=Herbidospora daliensis TaxID=295585 RepID=UPI000A00E0C5|nr:zinc ribbon domain-containing protein [Herbidospora daliensis]
MSRYRLTPTPTQEAALLEHCGHARYVWNLAVEQHSYWKPGRESAPGFAEQCRQLTEARAENAWLRAGSVVVQQQALKDFAQAMANVYRGTHRRPKWRRRGRDEGFRIVAVQGDDIRRLSRNVGEVKVPKVGWVRFRVEKTSTGLARRFDVIAVEDLKIAGMTRAGSARNVRQKAGLNRGILAAGWGRLVERLEHKAPGRVVRVSPAFTSQTCNACTHVARESRESQALFRCVACGHQDDADVNTARNIRDLAAGHAVNARGGDRGTGPMKREPQLVLLSA